MSKLKRLYSKFLIPEVFSFSEAENYCNSKTLHGYQSKLLCKYRFHKLDDYLKKEGSLFRGPSTNILLYCISYYLHLNEGRFPNLIDFGGACGENILFLESLFGKELIKKSFILESFAQSLESKNWEFAKRLNFSDDLFEILGNEIDIFFTSCALNYIPNPYDVLLSIAKKKVTLICLTRNIFSSNPKAFIQVSDLSENGLGEHLDEYGNPLIWYPSQTLCENEIKNIFLTSNYELIFDENIVNKGVVEASKNYSKDLIFYFKG